MVAAGLAGRELPTGDGRLHRQLRTVACSRTPPRCGAAAGCGERVTRAGSTRDGGLWLICARTFANTIVVRRLDAAGALAGDTSLSAPDGVDGDLVALSPDGETLFVWEPVSATLARIDPTTGEMRQSSGTAAASRPTGPLAALGSWLAPAAAAKSFLQSGVVVSPDGTRVYAAGLDSVGEAEGMAGSTGVHVFDAATLTSLGNWKPTADFISLAVSSDGRFVYAAGLARFDASGQERPSQQASITVFTAADGEVQVIAGPARLRLPDVRNADPRLRATSRRPRSSAR